MVLSIETTLAHPPGGFVKLEDMVAVTPAACIGFGDAGRDWTDPVAAPTRADSTGAGKRVGRVRSAADGVE